MKDWKSNMKAPFLVCPSYPGQPYRRPWQGPLHSHADTPASGVGLPAFRRRFSCPAAPVRAEIEVTALGVFELYLNGQRVGHRQVGGTVYDELKPGFTDFRSRVYTYRYDLTPYLARENTLVAVVAPGWWAGRISFGVFGLKNLAFACEISLTYPDGKQQTLSTDTADWETTVAGPVLFADVYDGETIDARLLPPYADGEHYAWEKPETYSYEGEVIPRVGPPVRLRPDLTRRPASAVVYRKTEDTGTDFGRIVPRVRRVGNGAEEVVLLPGDHLILDFGQNLVGHPRLTLSTSSGCQITVKVAEMLNDSGSLARGNDGPAGSLYVANYRTAHALIGYTAAGVGDETVEPLYSFYGFRYLEVTADAETSLHIAEACVLTSDLTETGECETDNAEVNRLIQNTVWGRRGNYLHVPTDCPQRDERLGWSGDTQIFAGAAAYLSDIRGFMQKWLLDATDSQKTLDGAYGDVIPNVLEDVNGGNAGWGDAAVMVPEVLYRMYGDTEILRTQYPSMEIYMDFLDRFGHGAGGRTFYGDWLAYEPTEKAYIAKVYYANNARLMAEYSRILSEGPGDFYARRAVFYDELFARLKSEWQAAYLTDGDLTPATQTAYLLALHFGLVDGETYQTLSRRLAEKIRENDFTLSTGFLGTGILAQTLSEAGEDGLAYSLLLQVKDPSWLYSVRQGATTVFERWNSYTRETGFGDVSMNSFNHYAYGAVVEWLYAYAAGIRPDPDFPGFAHLILDPRPDTRTGEDLPAGQEPIRRVSARYDSIRGTVESAWHYEGDTFVWHFTVPDGVTATISFPCLAGRVPDYERKTLTLNGVSYTARELCGQHKGNRLIFELPGGRYEAR